MVFCPASSSNSLVSASPRMPWAPCCACQGHCRIPAVSAAFPGWQMFPYLCLSTHCLSVPFPTVTRSPSGLLLQQGVSGVPLVPAARSCPGSGNDPQESHELCWTLGNCLCLSQFPAPVSEQALLCTSPWCLGGTATAPCATVAASCPGAPCSPPAPGLSGNVGGGEGPLWAQQRVQQSLPWAAPGRALLP